MDKNFNYYSNDQIRFLLMTLKNIKNKFKITRKILLLKMGIRNYILI